MFSKANNIINVFKKETFGLHIFIADKGNYVFYLLHLKKTRSGIRIIKQYEISDKTELQEIIKNSTVSVYISGKGILIKSKGIEISEKQDIFKKIFGNIDSKQFYIQTELDSKIKWIAIARKDLIEDALSELPNSESFIIQVSILPPINKEFITSFVDSDEIFFGQNKLKYNNVLNSIEIFESNLEGCKINDVVINNLFIPALYISTLPINQSKNQDTIKDYSKIKQFKLFELANSIYAYSAIILLLLIIINAVAFSIYFNKVNSQQELLNYNKSVLTQIDNLENLKRKKIDFITKQNVKKNTDYSSIINNIARLTPKDITLTSINVIPTKFKSSKIEIIKNEIQVDGISYNGVGVTEFIQLIKQIDWIKSINLVYYRKNKEDDNSNFQLKIKLEERGNSE